MIDAVRSAMTHIHSSIPRQILELAFMTDVETYNLSIDALIKRNVLVKKVRDDISVRGGKLIHFVVNQNWCKITQSPSPYALGIAGSYSVFQVPPEYRDHRDISCVVGIEYPYTLGATNETCTFYNNCSPNGNTLATLATAVLQSQTGSSNLTVPYGKVRPNNIIQLDPPQYNFVPWKVSVRLCFDDDFTGLDVNSIETFKALCEYATKSYIWAEKIVDIESNAIMRGVELGVVKDIVSSYADANEKYSELLLAFGGAQVYDPDRLPGILRLMVPSR